MKRAHGPRTNIGSKRLQSGNEVRPKTRRVVIAFVERQPGDRPLGSGDPFAHKRRLSKAGRRRDESQFAAQAFVQPLDQAGTEDNVVARRGDVKFGG